MSKPRGKTRLTAHSILHTLGNVQADLKRMGVHKIGLFGSYRRGTPTSKSDMDFLVVLERPSFDAYMDVKFFLEDLFDCPVDLVLEETIKPRLRPYILQEVMYAQGL
jgi:predicted nucleotidyltransferase